MLLMRLEDADNAAAGAGRLGVLLRHGGLLHEGAELALLFVRCY